MTINLNLTQASINNAINEVEKYKKYVLEKSGELVEQLMIDGEHIIDAFLIDHVDTGYTIGSLSHAYRENSTAIITVGGAAVWLEFGTGVTRNVIPHPKATELGISPWGTYGKGNGANPDGWYYYKDGKIHHTYGIQAHMFMYNSLRELERLYKDVAKQIFKG